MDLSEAPTTAVRAPRLSANRCPTASRTGGGGLLPAIAGMWAGSAFLGFGVDGSDLVDLGQQLVGDVHVQRAFGAGGAG